MTCIKSNAKHRFHSICLSLADFFFHRFYFVFMNVIRSKIFIHLLRKGIKYQSLCSAVIFRYDFLDEISLSEQYEAIYEVLNQYSIRSITFEGLDKNVANRINKMRPMPSNFVIFARPSEMKTLFDNVKSNNYPISILLSIGVFTISGNQIQCYRTVRPMAPILFRFCRAKHGAKDYNAIS